MKQIIDNFTNVLKNKYACFKGRAGRKEFWYFILVYSVLMAVLQQIATLIGGKVPLIVAGLVALAFVLPAFGITVRRLHDIGKSGWAVLVNLIPFVGGIIFLIWMIKEGDKVENVYGPAVQ